MNATADVPPAPAAMGAAPATTREPDALPESAAAQRLVSHKVKRKDCRAPTPQELKRLRVRPNLLPARGCMRMLCCAHCIKGSHVHCRVHCCAGHVMCGCALLRCSVQRRLKLKRRPLVTCSLQAPLRWLGRGLLLCALVKQVTWLRHGDFKGVPSMVLGLCIGLACRRTYKRRRCALAFLALCESEPLTPVSCSARSQCGHGEPFAAQLIFPDSRALCQPASRRRAVLAPCSPKSCQAVMPLGLHRCPLPHRICLPRAAGLCMPLPAMQKREAALRGGALTAAPALGAPPCSARAVERARAQPGALLDAAAHVGGSL